MIKSTRKNMSIEEILDGMAPRGFEDFCYCINSKTWWTLHGINPVVDSEGRDDYKIEYRCNEPDCKITKYLTLKEALSKGYEERNSDE